LVASRSRSRRSWDSPRTVKPMRRRATAYTEAEPDRRVQLCLDRATGQPAGLDTICRSSRSTSSTSPTNSGRATTSCPASRTELAHRSEVGRPPPASRLEQRVAVADVAHPLAVSAARLATGVGPQHQPRAERCLERQPEYDPHRHVDQLWAGPSCRRVAGVLPGYLARRAESSWKTPDDCREAPDVSIDEQTITVGRNCSCRAGWRGVGRPGAGGWSSGIASGR
jgi:hypothetical protein